MHKYKCSCGCYIFYLYVKDKVVIPRCVDCENEGKGGYQSGLIDPIGTFGLVTKGRET